MFVKGIVFLSVFTICNFLHAQGGMWPLFMVQDEVYQNMKAAGLQTELETIYHPQNPSISDAIVKIGRGCSGGVLSDNGLVITNFHCVEHFVNQISSVEQNYLRSGFWAHSQEDEILAPGLTVSVLSGFTDVTDDILFGIPDTIPGLLYQQQIQIRIDSLISIHSQKDSIKEYEVLPFFGGNQYILFESYVYSDIRFVGFMPAEVAAFGTDLDNWVWPRHSADFAFLRIYADSLNLPALHSDKNVMYTPISHIPVDSKGASPGDFTMVMGYPYVTNNFSTAHETRLVVDSLNPLQIALRSIRLKPIEAYMNLGEAERLQYHSKYYRLLNYYVKWHGEQRGLKQSQAIRKKQEFEDSLSVLLAQNDSLYAIHSHTIDMYNTAYSTYMDTYSTLISYVESIWRMDFFAFGEQMLSLYYASQRDNFAQRRIRDFEHISNAYFSNSAPVIEKTSVPLLIDYIIEHCPPSVLPEFLRDMTDLNKQKFIADMISESLLFNKQAADAFFLAISKQKFQKNPAKIAELLQKDKGMQLVLEVRNYLQHELFPAYYISLFDVELQTKKLLDLRMALAQSILSPEANGTLRISFGNVQGYSSKDAVFYAPQSTYIGIIEKWNLEKHEYPRNYDLDSIFINTDFGTFSHDTLFVNFIGTNQTTGGNSGSPVFNAKGAMIGLNFDRNMEGTMSDYFYDVAVCRNIMVDIRYILFCIEMYGKSNYILQELTFFK